MSNNSSENYFVFNMLKATDFFILFFLLNNVKVKKSLKKKGFYVLLPISFKFLTSAREDCPRSRFAAYSANSSSWLSGGYVNVGLNLSNSISKHGQSLSGFEPGIPIGFKVSSRPWGNGHKCRLNLSFNSLLLKSNTWRFPQAKA